jgi:hypothetical protein
MAGLPGGNDLEGKKFTSAGRMWQLRDTLAQLIESERGPETIWRTESKEFADGALAER